MVGVHLTIHPKARTAALSILSPALFSNDPEPPRTIMIGAHTGSILFITVPSANNSINLTYPTSTTLS
jgi:hypothetical protein